MGRGLTYPSSREVGLSTLILGSQRSRLVTPIITGDKPPLNLTRVLHKLLQLIIVKSSCELTEN